MAVDTKDSGSSRPQGDQATGFEQSLKQLEDIAIRLESDSIDLNEAMTLYEKGMNLAHDCQKVLRTAEQKVEALSEKNNTPLVEKIQPLADDHGP
jgi:exodeoxyribonuclease VII small subunit